MRLDIEAEAKARAIVPGNPDASELIKRVTTTRRRGACRRHSPATSSPTRKSPRFAIGSRRAPNGRRTGPSSRPCAASASPCARQRGRATHRPFHPRAPRERRPRALARSASRNADPPRLARSDRSAAHARRVEARSSPTRRRAPTRRPSIGCSPRPATASAWRRAGWMPRAMPTTNGYQYRWRARHVALARLGDRRVQPQPALRPVHARTDRRRHAAQRARSIRRSPPASTAIIAATPRTASSRKSMRSSMSWIASRRRPRCSWA